MIMANTAAAEIGKAGVFKPPSLTHDENTKPIDIANAIVLEASLEMPFSPKEAYDKFSDWSRHADWNPGVTSVEYVDPLNRPQEARWTMEAFAGLKIDWHTVPTTMDPHKVIAWKSVKGMQLEGQVTFTPIGADGTQTLMVLTSSYVVPRMMRRFFGRSKKGKKEESNQVKEVLEKFRDVVSQEQEPEMN